MNCSSVLVAAGVVPSGGLCSWCVSPDGAEVALCCGVWVSEGQGAESRQPPCPRVLVRFPPQPLTVPDRTVDVRLCTERRAGREGEEEAQVRSSRAVRFKLTFCFVGVEVRRPGRRHSAGPPSFIRSYMEERGKEQGIPPAAAAGGGGQQVPRILLGPDTGGEGAQWDSGAGGAHRVPKVLRSAPLHPTLRNGCSGLSSGSWVCSTQVCAPTQLLQMSEPKLLLFNFLLLILSLLVLHTSFPRSFFLLFFIFHRDS